MDDEYSRAIKTTATRMILVRGLVVEEREPWAAEREGSGMKTSQREGARWY